MNDEKSQEHENHTELADVPPESPLGREEVQPPKRPQLDVLTRRGKLVERVRDALAALPAHFHSDTEIEGLEVGDLFSLNSMLGGSIEVQVVQTLNRLRPVWDPDEEWAEYAFVRSSQTFPDVRLATASPTKIEAGQAVAMGLELKGWYLLSREGEPSGRYTVSKAACDIHDLLVVVPWRLRNVLAGDPVVYPPYVESARYAAERRNYYWTHERTHKGESRASSAGNKTGVEGKAHQSTKAGKPRPDDYNEIDSPKNITPYPSPKTKIADKPRHDSGGNFGRFARSSGLMDEYVKQVLETPVAGIQARHWISFFKAFAEGSQTSELNLKITNMILKQRKDSGVDSEDLSKMLDAWARMQPFFEAND